MRASIVPLLVLALLPRSADAHRLDEYLQATRIDLARDAVRLEIDLTPGVSVAPGLIALIDSNRDGRFSAAEAGAYAERVLREMTLEVDGARLALSIETAVFPEPRNLLDGAGRIRLTARAGLALPSGSRELVYRNSHRGDIGVYLVNPLVPRSRSIAITDQRRDTAQRELRLAFTIAPQQTLIERVKQFAARFGS